MDPSEKNTWQDRRRIGTRIASKTLVSTCQVPMVQTDAHGGKSRVMTMSEALRKSD